MPNPTGTRTAIATALNAVTGLRPVQAEGLRPDKLNLPTCVVELDNDAQPMNLTMSDWYDHVMVALIVSLKGGVTRSERSLGVLYGDVVEALVGVASVLNVERQGYGEIEVQGVEAIGAIFRLEVID